MKVLIEIKYLGKTVDMVVDFDDEKLTDETYRTGREINMDTLVNDFYDNAQITFKQEQ